MATGESNDLAIIRAREEHVDAIVELAASRSLDRTDPHEASRSGFLVSGYTADTYRARLKTAEHFYVAVKGADVVGFLLAYSDEALGAHEWLNHRIRADLGGFLVIKQVCVAPRAARQGVASRLYNHVLDQWKTSPVIAAVVAEPPNEASTRFHRRLGFQELVRQTPPDGMPRVVWVRRRRREALVQSQYGVAVDLYKHEDTTNWQKLNNFFYITAGLAAATAFALGGQGDDSEPLRGLAVVVAVIGFGASVAFSQMLRFGRRYLQARKTAVVEFERYLLWHGGERVVGQGMEGERPASWLRASPTGTLMVFIPALVAVCWLVVLVLIATG
ncbi:GNAT family N-acetyltransferase [Streptomyces sp. WMMC897]|uniref:GNAT family N-acetyltransferase n=1 Tax=Streptomyces sp. WMMC897 TaxID=3014782 RepID=UPI0022B7129B|nr:GNAT family N-acetyltransferase [Streptomyces sp. WMMC897]MCZ7413639.1 GNAT family N-acetyltransferase [Streptomyces sp. WMMC897]